MARVRMITRTVEVPTVKVMCVSLENKSVTTESATLYSMAEAKDADIMEAVKDNLPAGFIPVAVESRETKEVIFGMTEKEFLANAKVIER